MTVYKRSELTVAQLAAWEEESRGEWVLLVAPTREALADTLAEHYEIPADAVQLAAGGVVIANGESLHLRWREVVNSFQAYFPAKDDKSKVVRGPW